MSSYPIHDITLRWLEVVLSDRFGHVWHLSRTVEGLALSLEGGEGAIEFDTLQDCFLEARSDFPFTKWDAECEGWENVLGGPLPVPGVEHLPSPLIEERDKGYVIHFDILGLTYWMLARVEEIGRSDLDNHRRFPAVASHAYRYGYLDRPIVDEWLLILRQVIVRTWPTLRIKEQQFSMKVSHDVDAPSRYSFRNFSGFISAIGGDVIRRRDYRSALLAPWIYWANNKALHPWDPYNTFEWIMEVSEQHNLTSAFYFICGRTISEMDADYEPEHPAIRNLMGLIHKRGHEIGLHPSYGSYQNIDIISAEAGRLKEITRQENIVQSKWGGRMHYLRWEQPKTLRGWSNAGMSYDSTLGYADMPGFRCGTCVEYQAFDPVAIEALPLTIRPLVAMDATIIDKCYLGLGTTDEALNRILKLKHACVAVSGCFTLLWHNSRLTTSDEKDLYVKILEG